MLISTIYYVRKFLIKRLTELNNKYKEKTIDPKELEELQLMFSPPNYEARRNGKRDE